MRSGHCPGCQIGWYFVIPSSSGRKENIEIKMKIAGLKMHGTELEIAVNHYRVMDI